VERDAALRISFGYVLCVVVVSLVLAGLLVSRGGVRSALVVRRKL
jgi:hypothetical protein